MIDYASLGFVFLGLILLLGLCGLCFGGDWLSAGAGSFALKLEINPVIVGLTVVSMATSMPELITSFVAVSGGSPGLAVGNIVGSNIANIGLILGISALLMPISIQWRLIKQETPMLVVITVIFMLMAFPFGGAEAGRIVRWEGGLLLLVVVAYVLFLIRQARQPGAVTDASVLEEIGDPVQSWPRILTLLLGGSVALGLGAEFVFGSSVEIARRMNISETLIGLTIVAIGTSLPELAASIAATRRKQADIVAGNIVGSNIFNLLLIGGGVSAAYTLPISPGLMRFEMPAMLVLTVLLWRTFYTGRVVTRPEGLALVGIYLLILGGSTLLA